MSRYEIYQGADGEWRWRLRSSNGQILASGEGYKTKAGALRGSAAVRRAAATTRVRVLG